MDMEDSSFGLFTLKPSTYVHAAVTGSFTEAHVEEVAIIRGAGIIEIARLGADGTLETEAAKKTFSTVRSVQAFRPVGFPKDLLLLGSDSGVITLVEFIKSSEGTQPVVRTVAHLQVGRAGFRRSVPGEYVAADPSGRAIMAVSVDGHKVVATVAGGKEGQVSLRKPATFKCRVGTGKASRPAVVYSVVGLEVGTEAPSFAVLAANDGAGDQELDDPEDKAVTVYSLDVEKNQVTILWRHPASRTGAMLASVPLSNGSRTRPVFVLSENWVAYKDQECREIRAPLPRRSGLSPEVGVLPVAWALARRRTPASNSGSSKEGKDEAWSLVVQSEYGDLYSVSLEGEQKKQQPSLRVAVVDTIARCTALVVLAGSKVLWAAAEFGDQAVYGVAGSLRAADLEGVSSTSVDDKDPSTRVGDTSSEAAKVAPVFEPGEMLGSLKELQAINNMAPITYLRSIQGNLVALCGGGRASSMRVFTSGLPVTWDDAGRLPAKPSGVWTVTLEGAQYLLVGFERTTGVWQLVEEPEGGLRFRIMDKAESERIGFVTDSKTVEVGCLEDAPGSCIQVLEDSRFRRLGTSDPEWRVPGRRSIGRAAIGRQCLVLACGGTEVYCFRFAGPTGEMVKYQPHDMMVDINAVSVSAPADGPALVFATCLDLSLHVLAYGDDGHMHEMGRVQLSDRAECLSQLSDGTVLIGLVSGALIRASLSKGGEAETRVILGRTTQVGPGPLKMFKVRAAGKSAILALSGPSSLLIYSYGGRTYEHTLAISTPIDVATRLKAPENPECMLAISGNAMSILQVDGYGAPFSERSLPLLGTPRGVASLLLPGNLHLLVILESDDGGSPAIRVVDPALCAMRQKIELKQGDVPLCVTMLRFKSSHAQYGPSLSSSTSVCVGGATVDPQGPTTKGWIDVYAVSDRGLQWKHRTILDDYPVTALCAAVEDGLLLAGIGPWVRAYDNSSKRLLRRCDLKLKPSETQAAPVIRLCQRGSLIIASDLLRGVHCLQLQTADSSFTLVAEDSTPRLITDVCLYSNSSVDTHGRKQQQVVVVGGDKLGNLFMLKLPPYQDWVSGMGDPLQEPGVPSSLEALVEFHVGEVVTSVTTVRLGVQGTREAIAYATVTGSIGVVVPLREQEYELFRPLESSLGKQQDLFPTYRDHFLYRSPGGGCRPARGMIDVDLCEEGGLKGRAVAARDAKVDKKELERRLAEFLGHVSQVVG